MVPWHSFAVMGRPRKTTTKTTPVAATLHAVGLSSALKKPAEAIGKVIHIPGSFWPSGDDTPMDDEAGVAGPSGA